MSMRLALYNHLTANSGGLPVYNREDARVTPATGAAENQGYIVLWEEGATFGANDTGSYSFRVAIHYPPGYTEEIDTFIDNFSYLFRNPIANGGKYYQFSPGDTSPIVENDDKTISKDRLLLVPAWG